MDGDIRDDTVGRHAASEELSLHFLNGKCDGLQSRIAKLEADKWYMKMDVDSLIADRKRREAHHAGMMSGMVLGVYAGLIIAMLMRKKKEVETSE